MAIAPIVAITTLRTTGALVKSSTDQLLGFVVVFGQ